MNLAMDNNITTNVSVLDDADQQLIATIQNGLPISDRPYAEIARQLGISEEEIIRRISSLLDKGLIKRFGVVVRHHELGYQENAMVVWDVPDEQVHDVAHQIKPYPFITLCYRRSRQLPEWPYNLYCMIHGKSRINVMQLLEKMLSEHNWQGIPREVLFSKQRFKQRAANYMSHAGCK
jgi:DNA-binding Lrp family transcriptional regulator